MSSPRGGQRVQRDDLALGDTLVPMTPIDDLPELIHTQRGGKRDARNGVFVGQRFPELLIATPRLAVRPLTVADAGPVDDIFGDRLTRRWLPFPAEFGPIDGRSWCTEMAAERRALGSGDHYGVIRREDEQLVGCMWTKRTDWPARLTEVSFAVAPDARGFGFAAEAIDALAIELIMRHDFHRIEMRVASGNTASRRVAEKAGFSYEGLLRNAGHVYSGRVDLQMWSLVAEDLRAAKKD
jgi:[ribosomal protein S5]-alanine N-acetyltransferase